MSTVEGRESLPPAEEAERYTPVSGLAVTAISVAGLAAVIIGGTAIAVRISGKPAFQPMILLPAVIGAALAVAARWSIRHSEGARTGMGFANAAWWISILCGGSFGAYLIATDLAIRAQARDFSQEWFKKVVNSTPEAAFLWSLDPATRKSIDENDAASIQARFGPNLYSYRDNEFVRLLRRSDGKYEITPRGVKSWDTMENGYLVEQVFDLRTPEGQFSISMPVFGQDKPALGGRVWHVLLGKLETKDPQLTRLGRLSSDIQFESYQFLRNWAQKLFEERRYDAFLDTLPLAERAKFKDKTDGPEYQKFLEGSLIRVDGKEPPEAERKQFGADLVSPRGLNISPGSAMIQVGQPRQEFVGDTARVVHMVEINAFTGTPVVAYLTNEVCGDELLAEFKKLRSGDWKQLPILPRLPKLDAAREIDQFPHRGYRVAEVDVHPKAPRLGQPQGVPGRPGG